MTTARRTEKQLNRRDLLRGGVGLVAAYRKSGKKYPNLAGGQPNDVLPRYVKEDPAAETGAEGVDRKLGSLKDP